MPIPRVVGLRIQAGVTYTVFVGLLAEAHVPDFGEFRQQILLESEAQREEVMTIVCCCWKKEEVRLSTKKTKVGGVA